MFTKKQPEPKFKYLDQVVFKDSFYGELEGTVQHCTVTSHGFWLFKKWQVIYSVACQLLIADEPMMDIALVPEELIELKTEKQSHLKPVH